VGEKTLRHGLLPGQPELRDVLDGIQGRQGLFGDLEAENMLDIMGDVRRVAGAPLGPDLVAVGLAPVGERADREPGFLLEFAAGGRFEVGVVGFAGAGYGLPEAWC
jgi:hypothetical protein